MDRTTILSVHPECSNQVPTMTSLELVGFINAERKELAHAAGASFPSKGHAQLDHADFLKKVPEVLGSNAGNFSGVYLGGNGQERPCYRFPKREACLMAMSYSHELQAKVFDRMTVLETKATPAAPAALSTLDILTLAMESEKGRLEAVAQLAIAAPAIAHLQAVQSSKDDFTFQEMALILQEHGYRLGRNRLMNVLRRAGVLTKVSNLPLQEYRERGYFRVVQSIRQCSTGRTHVDLTTYVTGKGHNWLMKDMDTLLLKFEKMGGAV
jgi:phage antirepressor YoqD-like protein